MTRGGIKRGALVRGCLAAILLLLGPHAAALAQASPSSFTSGHRFDAAGLLTGTILPDPDGAGPLRHAAVRNSYDAAGRLIKVENGELSTWPSELIAPASWSGYTVLRTQDIVYDSADRKLRETMSSGGAAFALTQYSYDNTGQLECTAVRMNPAAYGSLPASACALGPAGSFGPDRITRNVYDDAGQLLKVQKAYGTPLQQDYANYTYTPNGKTATVTDANGNRTAYAYDPFDRLSRWSFPSKTAPGQTNAADYEEYGYDSNGNRLSLRKRDSTTIAYAYDSLNRLTQKTVPASPTGAAGYSVHHGYDLRGLQTYARFGSHAGAGVTNSYDAFGQLATSTTNVGGVSRTLHYQYDKDGNRTRITHPDGHFFTYAFDGLDRLETVAEDGIATLVSFAYNVAGARSSAGFAGAATSYGYDGASRLASLAHDLAGGTADQSLGFGYNPASQVLDRTSSNDAYAWTGAYNVSRPYYANGLNQYTSAGAVSFVYDANGNLISDGSSNFVYDGENRLVSATGAKTASLVYDPFGRLFQTSGSGGAATTQFLVDGDALVGEYDPVGSMLRRYVHGSDTGADDPLIWWENPVGGWRRGLFTDHQGSVIAVTDMSGNPVAINSYDSWGIPAANNAGRFQYTGQAWIPELGMYYYKARIYSPTLGRFMQTDPTGYDDGLNLYAYVGNDPVSLTDPDGKEAACVTLNRPCLRPNADPFGDMYRFFFGDIERAVRNPGVRNVATALVTITPIGRGLRWAQLGYRGAFSAAGQQVLSRAAGYSIRTVDDLTRALKAGHVRPDQVPLEGIRRGNAVVILNTRSRVALENAGVPRSRWRIIDKTNDGEAQKRLNDQLRRNRLPENGTSTRPVCSDPRGPCF